MNIVVLGGGTVGAWIAGLLCQHRQSVTVVDIDAERVRRINERIDVRAVTGSAAESSVLFQAGVLDADVCLAVTGQDEVNLVAAVCPGACASAPSCATEN
jgi:trk system potassium uptake protein TrkA